MGFRPAFMFHQHAGAYRSPCRSLALSRALLLRVPHSHSQPGIAHARARGADHGVPPPPLYILLGLDFSKVQSC